jgi:hypothetical protein
MVNGTFQGEFLDLEGLQNTDLPAVRTPVCGNFRMELPLAASKKQKISFSSKAY